MNKLAWQHGTPKWLRFPGLQAVLLSGRQKTKRGKHCTGKFDSSVSFTERIEYLKHSVFVLLFSALLFSSCLSCFGERWRKSAKCRRYVGVQRCTELSPFLSTLLILSIPPCKGQVLLSREFGFFFSFLLEELLVYFLFKDACTFTRHLSSKHLLIWHRAPA